MLVHHSFKRPLTRMGKQTVVCPQRRVLQQSEGGPCRLEAAGHSSTRDSLTRHPNQGRAHLVQRLSTGTMCSPEDIWQCVETFLICHNWSCELDKPQEEINWNKENLIDPPKEIKNQRQNYRKQKAKSDSEEKSTVLAIIINLDGYGKTETSVQVFCF